MSAPRCAAHPERSAIAGCAECGALLCAECRRVPPDGLSRCEACLRASEAPDREAAAPQAGAPSADREAAAPQAGAPPADREAAAPQAGAPSADREAAAPQAGAPSADHVATAQVAAPPAAPAPPAASPWIPWEQPHGTAVGALWASAALAARGPLRFMARVPWRRGDLRTPLVFALLCGTLGYVAATLLAVFGPGAALPPFTLVRTPETAGQALLALTTAPLQIALEVLLMAALSHIAFRLANVPSASYEATFRAYAYAQVPRLLLGLPGGQLLVPVVELVMVVGGFRLGLGLTTRQALVGFVPQALLFLLFTAIRLGAR